MRQGDDIIFKRAIAQSIRNNGGLLGADFKEIDQLTREVLVELERESSEFDSFYDYWVKT